MIAVIGAGSWGTTLANLLAEKEEVALYARNAALAEEVEKTRENKEYLPGIRLERNVKVVSSLECVKGADIVVISVPSQHLREKLKEMKGFLKKDVTIVNTAKGLETSTFKRMSEVIQEELPDVKVATLSGPNHSEEVSKKIPTATVIASENADLVSLKKLFERPYFKVYTHEDIIGVEICGSVKNITAIAAGIISALGLGDNATGSIITLGLREMVALCRHFGGNEKTAYGVAGVGDLVATCTSAHSRNRKIGMLMAKGLDAEAIKEKMRGMVAEGIMTCKAVHEYAEKKDIPLPLTSQVYKVLFEKKRLKNAIDDLKELI